MEKIEMKKSNKKALNEALEKYSKREISLGRAAELAKMPLADFMKVVAERKIPINYTKEDLNRDFESVEAVFKKLGPVKTINFFQSLGINKGNSVREIEAITEKMSKEDVMEEIKRRREVFKVLEKIRSAKHKPSMRLINKVIEEVRAEKMKKQSMILKPK